MINFDPSEFQCRGLNIGAWKGLNIMKQLLTQAHVAFFIQRHEHRTDFKNGIGSCIEPTGF